MLEGYSRTAVASILAAMVTAALDSRVQGQESQPRHPPPEPPGEDGALETALSDAIAHWERAVVQKSGNLTYRREFRELAKIARWAVQNQTKFGPTPPHAN